ncbi:MAG: SDR family oxidoreductase [Gammaproteobacteria bacterium]|nr:SDR family oxidoreductase [Gammaproteobacteria bacterium]MCY4255297.1 SDR family oxidoreductase [Gammaproteobacteria bacterium]MCY4340025.1 SDR family oxidoreductase [Gammaproteobacteria bacterium]
MPRVLITGASRGLGLEHARQYLAKGWEVVASARDPASSAGLAELAANDKGALRLLPMDVSDHARVEAVAGALDGEPLDIVLNNAGTYGPKSAFEGMHYQSLDSMDYGLWREMLEINLLSAFKVAVCFKPHLQAAPHPLLVNMSSDMGSIGNNSMGHAHAYRSSKAALNMLTKGMAIEWKEITVIAMAPGWCRTDLGGMEAPVDPAESVRMQQEVLESLESSRSGEFINRFGETVSW